MTLDYTRMGTVVQQQMEALEKDHPSDDCVHEIGAVMVLVEIATPGEESEMRMRYSEGMNPVALLQHVIGIAGMLAGSIQVEKEDEE
jgi:hypothetical protein